MVGVAGGVFLALRSVSAPSPVPARAPPPSPPATPAAPAHSADVPQVSEHLAPTATAEPIPPAPTELGPGGAPSASPAAATPPPTVTPSSPVTNSPPIPLPTPAARPLADRPAVRPVPASPRRPAEREGSRDALNARIKQIEDRMYAADNSGTPLGASVWRMFNEAKEAAGSATTPEERKAVASSLEQIEWKLPPAP